MTSTLFPFAGYWWLYLLFAGLVITLLAFDLVLHRRRPGISWRQAAFWTGVWIALAAGFALLLYVFASARLSPAVAHRLTLEFLAGYIVEESLSVDNMFVFALIFRYFAVPSRYQHRVLFYGILGAMVFRALFIGIGAALIRFNVVLILFGLFLIVTGIRMAFEQEKRIEPARSPIIRAARRLLPVTPEFEGGRFFVKVGGIRHITPLMIVLLFLESTDILFAIDSVPAVFGVTREPFIVYTSNVFAILGLRSMYFLLAGALDRFHALKYGLAAVLVFVGLKMVWLDHLFGDRFPIGISLAVIAGILAVAIVLSLLLPDPRHRAPGARIAPRLVGGGCILLSVAGFLFAAGPGQSLVPLPALARVPVDIQYLSAACYAVCGVLLMRGSGR